MTLFGKMKSYKQTKVYSIFSIVKFMKKIKKLKPAISFKRRTKAKRMFKNRV